MSKDQKNFFKQKNEWSIIKDKLLGGYLPQYFQKLLTSKKPIFYVDCFAGKGKFDDGQPGSPFIAMDIIDKCIRLNKKGVPRNAIQTCFIELNHAAELEKNMREHSYFSDTTDIVSGKFEEKICGKLQNKKGYNVFLYIDPYGIRALDSDLFDKFESYGFNSFEMLINFNSFGFFRDACRTMSVDVSKDEAFQDLEELVEYEPTEVNDSKQSQELLSRIAGGEYWKEIVRDYKNKQIDGYKAERILSDEYKKRLKKRYSYVLDMPIRLRRDQRPKYRMIHVSDHEDGCYLMADNMQRRKDELFINIQQKGQISMFEDSSVLSSSVEGDMVTETDVKKMIEDQVRKIDDKKRLRLFEADFCNEYGVVCPFTMIHDILGSMEKNGEVEIIREPATTITGKVSQFWDEKDGKKVMIRRLKA